MKPRALLYINARSRQGRERKAEVLAAFADIGLEIDDISSIRVKHLSETLRAKRAHVDRIVVGGGDGTLNKTLESLLELDLPVGVLPLGTANDLAATLALPLSIPESCVIAAGSTTRRIDVGWVNGKHFLNDASLGLSNRIVRNLDANAKKRWGIFAAAANFVRVLWRARPFHAVLRCDDREFDVRTLQITVGNGERFGGFIKSADADIADRRLELYSLEIESALDVFGLLPALISGRYAYCKGVRLERGREIEVTTRRPKVIYTDGERATLTPAVFRSVPAALEVFVDKPRAGGA